MQVQKTQVTVGGRTGVQDVGLVVQACQLHLQLHQQRVHQMVALETLQIVEQPDKHQLVVEQVQVIRKPVGIIQNGPVQVELAMVEHKTKHLVELLVQLVEMGTAYLDSL